MADSSMWNEKGKTLVSQVTLEGTGIHTGSMSRVTLVPKQTEGIVFVREDLQGKPEIPALIDYLVSIERRTVLKKGDAEIHTSEHLLATLYCLGIDRVWIRVEGPELPAFDGSSLEWVRVLEQAKTAEVESPRKVLVLSEAVAEASASSAIAAVPHAGDLTVDYILDHDRSEIPPQRVSFVVNEEVFKREIAPARTFVLESEARQLLKAGYGRGASAANTLVVGPEGVLDNTLRFPDEFARHKVLDLLGDLCLLGASLVGRVVGVRSGHKLNARLVKLLAETSRNSLSDSSKTR